MSDKKKNKNLWILLPVTLALAVFIGLSVSGNITKNSDKNTPTATTEVSVVNEDQTQKQNDEVVNSKVTLVAVGDNLIHNTLIAAGEQEDGSLDYTSLYANIKPEIEKADIAVIDQETILGGSSFEYTGYPLFNSPWEIGDAAIDAGFDIFNCATNHTMDMGWAGIEKELEYFSGKENVVALGINADERDYNSITYYEKNSITFALLNYTFGTNGIPLPEDKPWCVNLLDKDKVTADIKEARENADVVIVFPHWGTENSHDVSDYQKEYTQLFSDLGVDIVIGCHPHVLQPVEWVTNESTGKIMIVYYSLGNFISHQIELDQLCGGMAQLTIEKHGDEIEISSAKLVPIVCHYNRGENDKFVFDVYKLSDYTDELAASHSQSGGTVEYYTNLVNDVIDEEFISM
ncbi:MAG TPA: CapA family protein [Candidatus Eubacterium faecigallinarum]|nr:CapA family protein [Candidatus Eubacterium faecigallinarum]